MALAGVPPAVFMRVGNADDPRANRTRALLLAELERQLVAGGPAPTVTSIVRGAGVSRSAFYGHFTSIAELEVAAVRRALEELESVPTSESQLVAQTRLSYDAFFEHVATHRQLLAHLLSGGTESARDQLYRALVDQLEESLDQAPERPAGVDSHRAAVFLAGAVVASVSEWLAQPEDLTASGLAEQVLALMPDWFAGDQATSPTLKIDNAPA